MTVEELHAALDELEGRGEGNATVVVSDDGKEVLWQLEGSCYSALAVPNDNTIYRPDSDAPSDATEHLVVIG